MSHKLKSLEQSIKKTAGTDKQEQWKTRTLKTGTSENRNICKQAKWKTEKSGKQEQLKTRTQEHLKTGKMMTNRII